MAFKVLFIAHTPDADPDKHRAVLETGKYKLTTVLVRNQALSACRDMAEKEGIHSVMLCPGFTHKDIAEIAEAVGPNVSITVARGDGPSSRVTAEVFHKEGLVRVGDRQGRPARQPTRTCYSLAVAAGSLPRDVMLQLFVGTSVKLGSKIMQEFVFGMHRAFLVSFLLCLVAVGFSIVRGREARTSPAGLLATVPGEPAD